jgi:hypothetical protein
MNDNISGYISFMVKMIQIQLCEMNPDHGFSLVYY